MFSASRRAPATAGRVLKRLFSLGSFQNAMHNRDEQKNSITTHMTWEGKILA